jgi:two-component system NtrC family sensor kinase
MTAIPDNVAADPQQIIAEFQRKLDELTAQQAATVDILKVIASSPGDVQPVFEAVADRAMRLLDCWSVIVTRFDGECFQFGAARGALPDTEQFARQRYQSLRPDRASLLGRSLLQRTVVSSADALTEPDPQLRDYARKRGLRAILIVPLLRDDKMEGALILTRAEPGLFAPREIELVQTFANQAVIAIENARLFNETREALERQTASADILRIIGSSPTDVQPVFDAIVASLLRLFGTQFAAVQLLQDKSVTMPAVGGKPGFERLAERFPRPLDDTTIGGLVMLSKQTRQFVAHEDSTTPAGTQQFARDFGFNSVLFTPMIHNGQVIGCVGTAHPDAKVFDPHQITLIETFADQAVIAIQNVRMFDEVQARTRDLSESLQQQTATADMLKVISRSAFDLNMVTTAILQAAAQLCRASLATLHLRDGDVCRLVTQFGLPEAFEQVSRDNPIPARYPLHSHRQVRAGEFAQFTDAWSDSDYLYKAVAKLGGYRAIIVIPMMREDDLVGIFSLARPEPEPFTPGQIKLVQTFADQAAIAIENARLFNETKEALERQTATSEILRVISQSPADVQPVFDAIVQTAVRLIRCDIAFVLRCDGATFSPAAAAGPDGPLPDLGPSHLPIDPGANFPSRAIVGKKNVHLPDWSLIDLPEHERQMQALIGVNSALFLPLLREAECIGVLALAGKQANIFGESEIALAESFRDQASIAIENVRLFKDVQAKTADLQESLQQQTATADVLKVISRSAFDLKSVLTTLTESAKSLCGASLGIICLRDGEVMRLRAESGCTQAFVDFMEANPIRPGRATITGRVFMDAKPVHVADVQHDPEYNFGQAPTIGAYRAVLAVPLMRDGAVEGVLLLGRPKPGPFSQRQIDLVQTFADQAVIAIENARLFNETKEALERQTATAGILKVIASSRLTCNPCLRPS